MLCSEVRGCQTKMGGGGGPDPPPPGPPLLSGASGDDSASGDFCCESTWIFTASAANPENLRLRRFRKKKLKGNK